MVNRKHLKIHRYPPRSCVNCRSVHQNINLGFLYGLSFLKHENVSYKYIKQYNSDVYSTVYYFPSSNMVLCILYKIRLWNIRMRCCPKYNIYIVICAYIAIYEIKLRCGKLTINMPSIFKIIRRNEYFYKFSKIHFIIRIFGNGIV